ncbi:MAG: hypothetical protein ACRC7N_13090 [Clostridium sp.]
MKILIIKRKNIFLILSLFILIILILIFMFNKSENGDADIFNPIPTNKDSLVDLTGDGVDDKIRVISNKNTIDIEIESRERRYLLSKLCNNVLVDNISSWPIKIYIVNVSRNNRYELLVQGCKNGKPISYLFGWRDGSFTILNESNYNISGILDSNGLKTPQFIVLNSSDVQSSTHSYMFQDVEKIDITNKNIILPKIDNIFSFINLIETTYELDELPNIFSSSISRDDLAILWSFGKDTYQYSFEDGFFYDNKFDSFNNFTSISWRLTFERYNKKDPNSPKDELTIILEYSKNGDEFKISKISRD